MTNERRSDVVVSHRAIREYLSSGRRSGTLYIAGEGKRFSSIIDLARRSGVAVEQVSRRRLQELGGDRAREIVLQSAIEAAVAPSLPALLEGLTAPSALVLLLDHVTDPHNFGAILRSADQFGVDAVIVPAHGSSSVSAVVMESSAGTAPHVTIVTVPNLSVAIRDLKKHDFWVYAAEMGGESATDTRLTGRVALVLGSEGKGVSRLVLENSDVSVGIPTRGHADSLNVSVACGILLYEVRRQQKWL